MFPSERVEATPNGTTPNVGVYNDVLYQKICKTEKYESRTQPEVCVEHVYTNIMENRYCGCAEDVVEANESIEEDLRISDQMECDTSQSRTGCSNGEEGAVHDQEKSGKASEINGLGVSGDNT